MSGLFGLFSLQRQTDIQTFLRTASQKMSHQAWHSSESWISSEGEIGLGRIGIGIFNREHQPITSPNTQQHLFLCGELYQTTELLQKLTRVGVIPRDQSDPELALCAYQAYGASFAQELVGVFFIAIYDIERSTLILTNDRYGLYPHYYSCQGTDLVFAPQVSGVLCAAFITPKLDLTAVCEYLRFQQILGEKTFHESIKLFPYGSYASLDTQTGAWSLRRYWDWDHVPYRPDVTFNEAVEESSALLKSAILNLSKGPLRTAVYLSGGLDSRTIIGFMAQVVKHPIAVTYGARQSRDVHYAHKIAKAVHSQHYWFDIHNGNWVLDYAELFLNIVEGFQSWIHMHGIHLLEDLRDIMDVNISGWDGGTVMGHPDHINPIYNNPVDEWSVALRTYQQFNQAYTWPGLTDFEEHLLFTPEFKEQAVGRAFEFLLSEFSRFWKFRHEYAAEYFYITNHCWRSTQNMVTLCRMAVEARFPYWDYQLIDFLYSLKPEIRRDQVLFRTIITQQLPRLAYIPYDKEEFLPTTHRLPYLGQKFTLRILKKLRLFPERPILYVDYENYLRHELRPWAEEILFDPHTASRGIFNQKFVRSLMDRHLSSNENWTLGKIAPLITFEMIMREYFDG